MEQAVFSGTRGHVEWELKHSTPQGFLTLDSDKGVFPQNKSGLTGLDLGGLERCEDSGLNVDSLLRASGYFCSDQLLHSKGDQAGEAPALLQYTLKEREHGEEGGGDCTLSWLFPPGPNLTPPTTTDILGYNAHCVGLTEAQVTPGDKGDSSAPGALGELISLSEPPSPGKISDRTAGADAELSSLLVDLLAFEPFPSPPLPSPGLPGIALPTGSSPPPPPPPLWLGVGTVSPETGGDKGLFVTAPPTDLTATAAADRTPGCSPDYMSAPPEPEELPQQGPVSLLDWDVPACDGRLGLFPTVPASPSGAGESASGAATEEDSEGACPSAVAPSLSTSVRPSDWSGRSGDEEESGAHRLPVRDHCTSVSEQGDLAPKVAGEPPADCLPSGNVPEALMASDVLPEDQHEQGEVVAPDQATPIEGELCREEAWNSNPSLDVRGCCGDIPASQPEQRDGEPLTDLPGHLDYPQTDAFEFSALESSGSSPEPEWTSSGGAAETMSLSKMAGVPDPVVPTQRRGEEQDLSPLKAVFDALDQDGDGFVRIEEFMEFAAAYGADQVKDLTKFLDPSGLGVISFGDFHRGISAISNGGSEPHLFDVHYSPGDGAVGCQEEYDEQNEVTDSAYLGSESTYSECETFTDEDTGALAPPEMHDDVETDSGIDPEDPSSNRFSLTSDLHGHSMVAVLGAEEEHFEDFGESATAELLLEADVGDPGSPHHTGQAGGDPSSLLQSPEPLNGSSSLLLSPSATTPLPDRFQSFLREGPLDFFCSQCHKQVSRLEDLSTRLNFLEMTSSGKRLSSKKVARHLLQNSSMTLDTMSDLTRDILELADNDITDKVLLLERRVAELEKESEASGEQHGRLRQENLGLVRRANALEEQLREQEAQDEEQRQQDARRHKEALCKLERERGLEMENLTVRLQQLDEENSELRSCVPCLRANIERLEEEKRKLQDENEDMAERLSEEQESRSKMADKLSHERHLNQKEKESTQELIEDLRKQLEHLQLYKLEAEARRGRSTSAGLQEYQTRTREAELEQEVRRLKQDNRSLKEQNDELNGQIINLSIQGAKNLMSAPFSDSLAAEINSVSRGELMEAVHKQEEINYRLQDYIDKIIVAIMECNPSILEVK